LLSKYIRILGIGTDLLKEIETFMNSDKNEAVKKAVSKYFMTVNALFLTIVLFTKGYTRSRQAHL
jgi:hypothetical protein